MYSEAQLPHSSQLFTVAIKYRGVYVLHRLQVAYVAIILAHRGVRVIHVFCKFLLYTCNICGVNNMPWCSERELSTCFWQRHHHLLSWTAHFNLIYEFNSI